MSSVFLSNLHHAYGQTDGTYAFPNSREGDMLKRAKKEIEALRDAIQDIADEAQQHHEHNPVSKADRLPVGYRKILNRAAEALK